MDEMEKFFLYAGIGVVFEGLLIAVCCFFLSGTASAQKPCEMKVYQYMDEYRVGTSCGHIVIDRCPFCDKSVEIVVD